MSFIAIITWLLASIAVALAVCYFLFPGVLFVMATRVLRRAAGLHTRRIACGDHQISYVEGGIGEPLLLLHGFGGDKDHWLLIAKHLTPHFRVIAPDLPGFGDSTHRAACYAVIDQVDRIHGLVGALGLKSFHLSGSSMGGYIAAAYATRHPDQVSSLCLLAPAGVKSAQQGELFECLMRGENPLLVQDTADFERLMGLCFARPPYVPRPFKRYLLKRAIEERPGNERIFRDLVEHPFPLESEMRGLSVPTLILWGDRDRLLHVSGAAVLGSVLPHATVIVMDRCGHVPMVERPRETAEHVLRFIR